MDSKVFSWLFLTGLVLGIVVLRTDILLFEFLKDRYQNALFWPVELTYALLSTSFVGPIYYVLHKRSRKYNGVLRYLVSFTIFSMSIVLVTLTYDYLRA